MTQNGAVRHHENDRAALLLLRLGNDEPTQVKLESKFIAMTSRHFSGVVSATGPMEPGLFSSQL